MRACVVILAVTFAGCGAKSELRMLGAPPIETMDVAIPEDAGRDAVAVDAWAEDTGAADAWAEDAAIPDDTGAGAGRDAGSDGGNDAAVVVSAIGCADGEREAYRDGARYPNIAGCAGGWTRPGLAHPAPTTCDGQGGDDGPFPGGGTCGVSDLCAVGWHVCLGPSDVARSSPDGCAGSHDAPDSFFATRMSGPGCGVCATGSATDCTALDCRRDCAQTATTMNDIFGCGTLGSVPDVGTCGPLDRFGDNLCAALSAPWSCTDDGSGTHEAELVVKPGSQHGGVLCCRG